MQAHDHEQLDGLSAELGMGITSSAERIALKRLLRCMDEVRDISPELRIQTLQTLLVIAVNPGISLTDLMTKTKTSQSSCSRHVAHLSDTHWLKKPGLDLVVAKEDPRERRRKFAILTSKGRELTSSLADILR